MLRKYQPIWEQIKQKGHCSVAADPRLHRRIIRMVSKEKDNDSAFRVLMSESHSFSKLLIKIEGAKITWELKYSLSISDL